jgi:hypothetical protein
MGPLVEVEEVLKVEKQKKQLQFSIKSASLILGCGLGLAALIGPLSTRLYAFSSDANVQSAEGTPRATFSEDPLQPQTDSGDLALPSIMVKNRPEGQVEPKKAEPAEAPAQVQPAQAAAPKAKPVSRPVAEAAAPVKRAKVEEIGDMTPRCFGGLSSEEFKKVMDSRATRLIQSLYTETHPDISPAAEEGRSFLLMVKLISNGRPAQENGDFKSMLSALPKKTASRLTEETNKLVSAASHDLRTRLSVCLKNDMVFADALIKDSVAPVLAMDVALNGKKTSIEKTLYPVMERNFENRDADTAERKRVQAQQFLLDALFLATQSESGKDALRYALLLTSSDPLWNLNHYLLDEVRENLDAVNKAEAKHPSLPVASRNAFEVSSHLMDKWSEKVRSTP